MESYHTFAGIARVEEGEEVEGLEFRSQYLARLKRILEKVGVSGVLSKWSNLD
jgi:hypothetical protein